MVLARWAGRRSDDNASTQQQIGNLPGRGSKGVIECSAGETTRQLLIGFVSNLHEARWPADARLEPGEAEPQPCPPTAEESDPVASGTVALSCGSNVLSLIDLFKFKFDHLNTNLTI
jgi:hypothetical protein